MSFYGNAVYEIGNTFKNIKAIDNPTQQTFIMTPDEYVDTLTIVCDKLITVKPMPNLDDILIFEHGKPDLQTKGTSKHFIEFYNDENKLIQDEEINLLEVAYISTNYGTFDEYGHFKFNGFSGSTVIQKITKFFPNIVIQGPQEQNSEGEIINDIYDLSRQDILLNFLPSNGIIFYAHPKSGLIIAHTDSENLPFTDSKSLFSTDSLKFGQSFTVPKYKLDGLGHIKFDGVQEITMPELDLSGENITINQTVKWQTW